MGLAQRLAPAGSRRRAVIRKLARRFFRGMRRLEYRFLTDRAIRAEEDRLKRSWAKHSSEILDEYLVTGYQNPRINAQSILARHFFIRRLFGTEFDELMREELQFCVESNEAIRKRAKELGVTIGAFTDPNKRADVRRVCEVISDREHVFESRWRDALAGRSANPIRVLELACGSANDYRSLAEYGIARFLRYTGVDLSEKNVANARRRYPGVDFEVGSILRLPYDDGAFEYVLAFDIFEHLSLVAMEEAMAEAARLASAGLVLSFFVMTDTPQHIERPMGSYHWNELSAGTIEKKLNEQFSDLRVTHVPAYLKREFGYGHYYNKRAYTMIAQGRR